MITQYTKKVKHHILRLAQELIAIPSVSTDSLSLSRCIDIIKKELSEFTIEEFSYRGCRSILVYATESRPSTFDLLLNCHVDVIPAKPQQYKPQVRNKKLYGAGALDMKTNLACAVYVFRNCAKKKNSAAIGLQIVTDEETGGFYGTKLQIEKGVRARFVISTETTQLNIAYAAKGILHIKVHISGKTAHGAYPWRGSNAIVLGSQCIVDIMQAYPTPKRQVWQDTVNISCIHTTNTAFNKIPDNVTIDCNFRYIPGHDEAIINTMQKIIHAYNGTMDISLHEAALDTDPHNAYITLLQQVCTDFHTRSTLYRAQGSSDVRHYAKIGIPGIEFGAVGGGIGSDIEWIDMRSIEIYYDILEKYIQKLPTIF